MKAHNRTLFGLCLLALLVLLGTPLLTRGQGNAPAAPGPVQSIAQHAQSIASSQASVLDESGAYTARDDVALYLVTYGHLPGNFITKEEARALGWPGGGLEEYAPGKCIGGDVFGNYEGLLPEAEGRIYHECDIDTLGKDSRGAKRLVYSSDGLIYYTDDHYESFTLLYGAQTP